VPIYRSSVCPSVVSNRGVSRILSALAGHHHGAGSRVRLAGVVVCLVLTAACGSTVPLGTTTTGSIAGSNGAGANGEGLTAVRSASSSTQIGPGGITASGVAASDTSGGGGGTAGPAGSSTLPTGRGSNKPIKVGYYLYNTQQAAALSVAFGYRGNPGDWGDGKAQSQLFVDYLNATGGLLRHPIQLVFSQANLQSDASTNEQAACAAFTQDNHVTAVISGNGSDIDVLQKCLHKYNVPLIESNVAAYANWTDASYKKFPLFAFVNGLSWNRLADAYVDQLVAEHYFTGWDPVSGQASAAQGVKIGVVAPDTPEAHDAVDHYLQPALARRGLKFTDEAFVTAGSNDYSSVVLRFRSANVSHVLFTDISLLTFGPEAESQHYRPRYGLSTKSWPRGLTKVLPAGQLHGATGVGWMPLADMGLEAPQRPAPSASEVRCVNMMTKGGQDMSHTEARINAGYICDMGWLLRAAFTAGGGLGPNQWLAGLNALHSSVEPAVTFMSFYGPGRHDGVARLRQLAYDDSCSCFQYKSGPIKV